MIFSINSNIAQNLFLMLYALCLGATISVVLPSMFNYGVGIIFKENLINFLIRAIFMGLFFILNSITFLLGLYFIGDNNVIGFVNTTLYVFIIIIISMSPWFCDHLARLLLFPARKKIQLREEEFKYVDVVFIAIYIFLLGVLLLLWRIIH